MRSSATFSATNLPGLYQSCFPCSFCLILFLLVFFFAMISVRLFWDLVLSDIYLRRP